MIGSPLWLLDIARGFHAPPAPEGAGPLSLNQSGLRRKPRIAVRRICRGRALEPRAFAKGPPTSGPIAADDPRLQIGAYRAAPAS